MLFKGRIVKCSNRFFLKKLGSSNCTNMTNGYFDENSSIGLQLLLFFKSNNLSYKLVNQIFTDMTIKRKIHDLDFKVKAVFLSYEIFVLEILKNTTLLYSTS